MIILYTYLGYASVLYIWGKISRWMHPETASATKSFTPTVTIVVAAYNEASCIEEKIKNTLALYYPHDKISFIFVTDGSSDETPQIVSRYPQIKLLHAVQRRGKVAAVRRAMKEVQTEVVVFTDANTMLNREALLKLCQHYSDAKTGGVAGEKRVDIVAINDATAGEGLYWKYESRLKKWESELYSVLGAAGELFSIRSSLYEAVPPDTIVDDFMISMKISLKGYRIRYEPGAYAIETGSTNISEEWKRKVRIAAGGVQSLLRLPQLLVSFEQPLLIWEYLSHRVLRWVVTPYLLVLAFVLNTVIVIRQMAGMSLSWILFVQCFFYCTALLGWLLEKRQIRGKAFFIPYYFCLMNYAMIAGMFRYVFAGQTVLWDRAKRK